MRHCGVCHELTNNIDICLNCKEQRERMTVNIKKKLEEKKNRENSTQ